MLKTKSSSHIARPIVREMKLINFKEFFFDIFHFLKKKILEHIQKNYFCLEIDLVTIWFHEFFACLFYIICPSLWIELPYFHYNSWFFCFVFQGKLIYCNDCSSTLHPILSRSEWFSRFGVHALPILVSFKMCGYSSICTGAN